jgi:hypothetical protein
MIVLAPAHFVFRPGSLQAEAEQRRRRNVEPEDLGAAGGRERWSVAVSAKKSTYHASLDTGYSVR